MKPLTFLALALLIPSYGYCEIASTIDAVVEKQKDKIKVHVHDNAEWKLALYNDKDKEIDGIDGPIKQTLTVSASEHADGELSFNLSSFFKTDQASLPSKGQKLKLFNGTTLSATTVVIADPGTASGQDDIKLKSSFIHFQCETLEWLRRKMKAKL